MSKLYELTEDFLKLQVMMDTAADDVDFMEVIKDSLASVEGEMEHKIEYLIRAQKNYEAEADMFKAEKDKLAKKQKTAETKAENLKQYIEDTLKLLGYNGENGKKLKAGLWTAAIQRNPAKLEIEPDAKIPEYYYSTPAPVLDKKLLMEDVKNGQAQIPGVRAVQTESIRIR